MERRQNNKQTALGLYYLFHEKLTKALPLMLQNEHCVAQSTFPAQHSGHECNIILNRTNYSVGATEMSNSRRRRIHLA